VEGGRKGEVIETEICVAYGRQGLVCSLWVKEEEVGGGRGGGREGGRKGEEEVKEGQVLSCKEEGGKQDVSKRGRKRTKRF